MRAARRTGRRGSVMIEFAFIALAFYLLFAGTLELGRMIATDQIIQNAARVGARELALVPMPAITDFSHALTYTHVDPNHPDPNDPQHFDVDVAKQIYSPNFLAVVVTGGGPTPDITNGWPIINKMLYPMMVVDHVDTGGGTVDMLHFPGAVIRDSAGNYSVAVPHVVTRDAQGHESIMWLPVLEEIRSDPNDSNSGPFSLLSTGPQRGLVALRINCPYQASSMSAFRQEPGPGPGQTINSPVLADDNAVIPLNQAPGQTLNQYSGDVMDQSGAFAGQYGLGRFYAMGTDGGQGVRPFRRLISAQAMFRREVYSQ